MLHKKPDHPLYTLRIDLVLPKTIFKFEDPIENIDLDKILFYSLSIGFARDYLRGPQIVTSSGRMQRPKEKEIFYTEDGWDFCGRLQGLPFHSAKLDLEESIDILADLTRNMEGKDKKSRQSLRLKYDDKSTHYVTLKNSDFYIIS